MKTIKARILDSTHLELSQPIPARPGDDILISIPDSDEAEDRIWQDAARHHLLNAYDDRYAVYDGL